MKGKRQTIFTDLGRIRFADAWEIQKAAFSQVLEAKEKGEGRNYLFFCEHEHVYTLGKSGKKENLLVDEAFLKTRGAEFFRIDRGGDITYHGPGQIVGYPVFNLESMGLGIKEYVWKLEEAIIHTLDQYGMKGERLEGATGVWLDASIPGRARKICAIGVKASRYITMHGFAFNLNTDLGFFRHINPCGFTDKGVTSVEKEIGQKVNMNEVKTVLLEKMNRIFLLSLIIKDNI
ncbi:MAG: lipoyl(octanoyl) transferase LipB [Bacteroidota bacterium]